MRARHLGRPACKPSAGSPSGHRLGAPFHNERHRLERSTLNCLVQQQAASCIAHTEASKGNELLRLIKAEFDAFLGCGTLAHGFLRLRCGDCGHGKLLAFSCKRHGFNPSCGAPCQCGADDSRLNPERVAASALLLSFS